MKLTSPEVINLIRECSLQETDVFLRLSAQPRFEDLRVFARERQTRTLVLLPGKPYACGEKDAAFFGVPFSPEKQPCTLLFFADVRELMKEDAPKAVRDAGLREWIVPFYECAGITEYGYKTAYGCISDLRAQLPFPVHVTAISADDHLSAAVFEALGTDRYILAGETLSPDITSVRTASERAAFLFAAGQCEKSPLKRVVVQCVTRTRAEALYSYLRRRGVNCGLFHGGRTEEENGKALTAFASGRINVLAATKSLLPCYPFLKTDRLFCLGLPYSVSHAARLTALSENGKLTCIYCDGDILLHEKLTASFAAALDICEESFFETRKRQLNELMNLFYETEHS